MNYNYLVPANSKKQGLILGLFTITDLIILGVGITLTFMLLLILNSSKTWQTIIAILPGLIAAFLVFPIPNFHNTRVFFRELFTFYFVNRRKYIWRGWCYKYDGSDK